MLEKVEGSVFGRSFFKKGWIMENDYALVHGKIVKTTEKAILIDVEVNRFRSNEKWVPRSVIEDGDCYNNYSGDTDFYVQSWFVKKEGLIEEVY